MEDMEIRLSNAKENEAIFINEMSSLKNQFIMKTAEFEKEQSRTTELEQKLQFLQSTVDELQAKEVSAFSLLSEIFFNALIFAEKISRRNGITADSSKILLSNTIGRFGSN